MAEQLYYSVATATAYTAFEARYALGFDPSTYDVTTLPSRGVYTVTAAVDPFNETLYTTVPAYAISGNYAVQSYTPTAKTLADVQPLAIAQRAKTQAGRIKNLREESGYGARIFLAVSGLTNSNRPAPFQAWMIRQQATITELGADIVAIDGAANVDAVNDIVSAAWGSINIGYDPASPLDLLASDFTANKFYSKNFTAAGLELYFPQTTTTVTYSGGFAATASAFTAIDHTVQLRITATGHVIDEFCVPASATVVEKEFGFKKYLGLGLDTDY